jgi:hypothetical protein
MSIQTINDFTPEQIIKIHELLEWIGECNGIGSDCKVDGIELFKDKRNNFYASYAFHSYSERGPSAELAYVEINREGERIDLTKKYENTSDIAIKLAKLEKIKLTD